jgi:hypothetical protein
MKQHININDWDQLTKSQAKRLREWLEPEFSKDPRWETLISDITIGKMIEFLNEHGMFFGLSKSIMNDEFVLSRYSGVEYINKSLCDALWEAVREILNKPEPLT